jgi:hypothetical protein
MRKFNLFRDGEGFFGLLRATGRNHQREGGKQD